MTSWQEFIQRERSKAYFQDLEIKVAQERTQHTVFPEPENVFKAFELSSYKATKVLILGQDPYIGTDPVLGCQAQGLSFSVPTGMSLPPSLRNIYKELHSDLGLEPSQSGNLQAWAEQGVCLLNSVLTVRKGESNSHKNLGWTKFTDKAIQFLSEKSEPMVFVLWGGFAQKKAGMIDTDKHKIIASAHPSPLSAHNGFFGSKPFSQVNDFLESIDQQPINWKIP